MAENKLANLHNVHFIGIGGAGMSALAYVLIKRGYDVSGSDLNAGHMSAHLAEEGAMVYMGHDACQVDDADAVVISTAIHPNNPELVAAKEKGLPVLHRSDVLAALLNNDLGVAVASAHGKTTTSAMISCIAAESGIDPTIVTGGRAAGVYHLSSGRGRFRQLRAARPARNALQGKELHPSHPPSLPLRRQCGNDRIPSLL